MSENLHPVTMPITAADREKLLKHKAATIWMTGLSGAGKSTLAVDLANRLHKDKVLTYVIDGDNIRTGLCKGLGFTPEDRSENVRRVAELCKILNDSGVFVIVALISPYQADRDMARSIIGDKFNEVYVSASLSECEVRDPKGLYKKARTGEIKNFTGISAPYEVPVRPELTVNTHDYPQDECVQYLMGFCWTRI